MKKVFTDKELSDFIAYKDEFLKELENETARISKI